MQVLTGNIMNYKGSLIYAVILSFFLLFLVFRQ